MGYSDPELDAILARADRDLIGLLLSSFGEIALTEAQIDRVLTRAYQIWETQP